MRAVSQLPVGSHAEDAQHSRKRGSRRDAPSQPACKSTTRSSLTPGCGILGSPLHARSGLCAEVARCEVSASPERRQAVRRSVRERAACRGSCRRNGAGSGYLAECSLMPIQASAAKAKTSPSSSSGPQTTPCGSGPAAAERRAGSGTAGRQWRRGHAGGEHLPLLDL